MGGPNGDAVRNGAPDCKENVGIFDEVELCPDVRDLNLLYDACYISCSDNTQCAY